MNLVSNEVSRAHLMRHLDSEQVQRIRAVEASFRPNEYLTAQQVIVALKIQMRLELKPEEIEAMQLLWEEFVRTVLWKQQQIENARHPAGCTMTTCRHPWNPLDKTRAQEIHQWEDYALRHYKAPQIAGRNLEQTLGV